MTQSEQIELLGTLDADVEQHRELYQSFQELVSASPISGSREETIKVEYIEAVDTLRILYQEVMLAIATWLTEQP